jgi:autotransporter translocation and assembly factor TamB
VSRNQDQLSFVLGSDPPMEATDIVSYLASGRRASDVERFGGEGPDAADLGASIALSRLTADVEEAARDRLGLDVVEIQQDGLNGLTLAAGRFATPRLFIGFQQPVAFSGGERHRFGIDQTQVNAEYRVNEWLLTRLAGANGLLRIFMAVERAY